MSFSSALPGISVAANYTTYQVPCFYLETEEVKCTSCSWGGPCALLVMGSAAPPSTCAAQGPPEPKTDRPGADLSSAPIDGGAPACAARCCAEADCTAWTYVATWQGVAAGAPPPPYAADCVQGGPCCWLKSGAPPPVPTNYPGGITSGLVTQPPPPPVVVPPTGVRNAVPSGGLGAGTLELRGDGSFHELTFHSASPAGSAKYGPQDSMLLGVKWAGGAAALRTNPPAFTGGAGSGVASLTYRGAYPVGRLDVGEPALAAAGLTLSLFAHHRLVPGDAPASAAPAATFTLTASNSGAADAPLSLALLFPMGGMENCRRVGGGVLATPAAAGAAGCLHACAATAGCAAWNFAAGSGGGGGNCTLLDAALLMVFEAGTTCGVQGGWTSDGAALSLSMHPLASEEGPTNGDVTLAPVGPPGAGTPSLGAADDAGALWAAFAAQGGFGTGVSPQGVTGGVFANVSAVMGGAALSGVVVPAGGSVSLSIVLAWHFPNRDFYGKTVGQMYANLFPNSRAVAAAMNYTALTASAAGAAVHTQLWGGSSLPAWLGDHMVNQFSHFRNFIYSGDGLMREHEANDCPDLDSVHNDYQRHLPYLWAVPEFEAQKSALYQNCQQPDGMITENPGFTEQDGCGGRQMGDVTTIWILEVLEIWRHTNNTARLRQAWPAVVRGVTWQIQVSADYGLPAHLVCTYDILAMERYNTTTFNGVLHLAAMRAAMVMGAALGDAATVAAASAAADRAHAVLTGPLLWNSTYGYWRAYTGGDAIMSDCLYGQQVALAHGLGWLLPQAMVASHLAAELRYNANPFGLTTVTGRKTPPPAPAAGAAGGAGKGGGDAVAARKAAKAAAKRSHMQGLRGTGDGQDDAVWMGAAPTWSCLALALGAAGPAGTNVSAALEPTRWELENYRNRLRSMWDLTGLSTTGDWGADALNGAPLCTSHYGFMCK